MHLALTIARRCKYFKIRRYSTNKSQKDEDLVKIRNIGILAHIDAGKTTTTERMLYFAGTIKQMGEVHHGNTVTDYMSQERERGITIRSAAVTFHWKKHQFNLIDTPGHIDFTMEVEQTLNVLDGAVVVLDASAGVEAQTLTVWQQANRYKIPRLVFVNKMDRSDANLQLCCESIEKKLGIPTVRLHIPIVEKGKFIGIIDVVSLEKLTWDSMQLSRIGLSETQESKTWELASNERLKLIDLLSNFDDSLANSIIESETLENVKTVDVTTALKNVVMKQKVVPVLCGSAYKNIGVEPLMDAVILYLPTPSERNLHFNAFESNLCAKAFKIVHEKQRGAVTFFRIYSGCFTKGQKIFNIQKNSTEQSGKIFVPFADNFREVESLSSGNIAVVTGLKQTTSGDLVCNSATIADKAKKKMLAKGRLPSEDVEKIFQENSQIPEPVFFCSIEPPNLSSQTILEQALTELQREDPSLRVTHDTETGQMILGGMGELHLEIIKDRILKEYKVDAELGKLQISYPEEPIEKTSFDLTMETKIGSSKQAVRISLSLVPSSKDDKKETLILDKSPESASNLANIRHKHLSAIRQGINVALTHGPRIGSQVINVNIILHALEVGRGTTESVVTAATTQCVQKLLKQSGTNILEPVMYLEIVCPDEYVSSILADLSRRRALIQNVSLRSSNKLIMSEAPLSELFGYSTILRTISSGTATFSMEFLEYRRMSPIDETKAVESVRGF